MHKTLFITGLIYEASKRDALTYSRALWQGFERQTAKIAQAYDKRFYSAPACTGDITCERIGVRHKTGCLGKVEPIDVFWKKVQG